MLSQYFGRASFFSCGRIMGPSATTPWTDTAQNLTDGKFHLSTQGKARNTANKGHLSVDRMMCQVPGISVRLRNPQSDTSEVAMETDKSQEEREDSPGWEYASFDLCSCGICMQLFYL